MKTWTDETTGCKMCEPDCADEWLFQIWAVSCDYDGENTVEGLKRLIDARRHEPESKGLLTQRKDIFGGGVNGQRSI